MSAQNLFAKLSGTPAQILVILGLGVTLFVPAWRHYREAGVLKAQARFDQAVQMVKLDVEDFKKGQLTELKSLNENTTLSPQTRQEKVDQLRAAATAKMEELQKTYDDMPLKRAWLAAQSRAIDTRWPDLAGWIGRVMLLLGLLALTVQSDGMRQKSYLIVLLVALLASVASMSPDLSLASLGQMGGGTTNTPSASVPSISQEVSQETAKLLENLPIFVPAEAPMVQPQEPGVTGGVPGGVVGGVLGGVVSTPAPPPPPAREIPKAPMRVRMGGNAVQSGLIHRVNPVYPPLAKAARIQGTVVLEVSISKQGAVENVSVLRGHPLLIQAAIDAVKQWQYMPILLNGEPTEVVTTVTVNFTLTGG